MVVMSNGQIEQVDSPVDLYAAPKSRFVFDFLGSVNVFSGAYQQGDTVYAMPHRGYFFNGTDTEPHRLNWPFLAADSLVYDI
ncbi:hypothetical protein BZG74_12765 [Salinivibrio sharmensis]|uniref:MalK OB fold domain-containing protein n=1 Tax=Salinivibrio sharmensis TaxID=390883 RepID=A0ABX3KC38_9GAMM|nr:hypothetical protein BZG74_12765 [Salinivibrio sharmensis]